ncbi:3'-5' exonuclease family protein [Robertkochia aurantiaca]|uniref:3'-5' exonuclease family protein n=1 Tax=Robertkochia aurantiaca TaxID=2873700 RepID=UPI001CCF8D77|nr:exonuclease domain-containing protein [Robertkochia sp. 3YJGBD-33]
MQYAVVDVETTGMGVAGNRVTEIAIVVTDGQSSLHEYHTLVNPQTPISPYVSALTGIDDSMVQNAPTFGEIAGEISQILKGKVFVAHNVSFDYNVLRKEFAQTKFDFNLPKICTVRLSRALIPGLRSYSLGKLCSALQIPLHDRHRALGDTLATVKLFQLLVSRDTNGLIPEQLNRSKGYQSLPSLLSKETVDGLPQTPGIYYFKDASHQIIYVGKAKNIRKRVIGHFYDKKPSEQAMCRETAHIDFEVSGSELLALLMESVAIKKHYPKFNRAQKRRNKGFGIFSYTNRQGILQVAFNDLKMVKDPLRVFYNQQECLAFLEAICEEFELCPRFTQLQTGQAGRCRHYRIKNCQGVCCGEETFETYNGRVLRALEQITENSSSFVICEKGRSPGETAFVFVENGHYAGYGFVDQEQPIERLEDFRNFMTPQPSDRDNKRIIHQYLNSAKKIRMIGPEGVMESDQITSAII